MAKYPEPGQVKTRLASAIGPQAACTLYRAFILDLAWRLEPLGFPITWAHWPAEAAFASLVAGARCVAQEGRDLGDRMAHASAAVLAADPTPVLVIGTDSPHLPLAALKEAANALAGDADVVLGPAEDGGYWLVGLRTPTPGLFEKIAWGDASVFTETLERAEDLGLRVHVAAGTFDVDEPDSLEELRAVLRRGEVDLPRTARLLGVSRA
jgi:hypothetical protein